MQGILTDTKNAYFYYCFYSISLTLLLAAISYLFFSKKTNRIMLYFALAVLVMATNPAVIYAVTRKWMPMHEYWKFYYLLQTTIFIGYAITDFWLSQDGKKKKWIVACIFAIIYIGTINFDLSFEQFGLIKNPYRIEENIVDLAEILEENDVSSLSLLVPEEVRMGICEYIADVSVVGIVGAADFHETVDLETGKVSFEGLEQKLNALEAYENICVVLEEEYNNEAAMKSFGYKLVDSESQYYIYK